MEQIQHGKLLSAGRRSCMTIWGLGELLVLASLLLVLKAPMSTGKDGVRPDVAQPLREIQRKPLALTTSGTHRVAVDGPRPAWAATPFQGLVDAEDQWSPSRCTGRMRLPGGTTTPWSTSWLA